MVEVLWARHYSLSGGFGWRRAGEGRAVGIRLGECAVILEQSMKMDVSMSTFGLSFNVAETQV